MFINTILSKMAPYTNPITLISIFVTISSIIFGIVEQFKRKKAEKKLKSITWQDMQNASSYLARKLIKNYHPAVIYIPNIKSGIMLQFIKNYFKEYIPVIVGQTLPKDCCSDNDILRIKDLDNYWHVDTAKWHTYIPKALLEYKNQNILILDNLSLTGNFLQIIIKELISHEIPKEHIATACIATTEAAIADETAPESYYKTLYDSKNIYLPWG